MLEAVIKTREVCGKTVIILLYSIAKEDRGFEDSHNHYYEIRVSENDEHDNFYEDSYYYTKRSVLITFNQVCKEIEIENDKRIFKEYEERKQKHFDEQEAQEAQNRSIFRNVHDWNSTRFELASFGFNRLQLDIIKKLHEELTG